jgi:hypothetical protein
MFVKNGIIILLSVLLMSLSSCIKKEPIIETKVNPVTEKQIRENITEIMKIDSVTTFLKNLKIDSNIVEGDRDTIITTIVIVKGLSTSILKVTLHYLVMVNNYVYSRSDVEEISTVTAEGPTLNEALEGANAVLPDVQTFTSVPLSVMSFPIGETKCLKSEPHPESGNFYLTCSSSYKMLETTAVGTTIIKATYTFNQGWIYKVDNWTLVVTTKLDNLFNFIFESEFRNEDTLFVADQVLEISLNGTMIMTYRSDNSITVENNMTGSMTTKGKTIKLIVVPGAETDYLGKVSPDSLKLIFGNEADAYLLICTEDGMGHGGEADPPYWIGIDAAKNYFYHQK